jgi:GNAT superfamily N-acetyltransferase
MIERLTGEVSDADLGALAQMLVDAVHSGSAISFLDDVTVPVARAWWRNTMAQAGSRAVILVARERGEIVGTVQVHPAWAPNQPHRGDVAKLLVRRDQRRRGVGEALMRAAVEAARGSGLTLLTLDTKCGDPAERLYRRLGWTHVGNIPGYALDPDRRALHGTAIFYLDLPPAP